MNNVIKMASILVLGIFFDGFFKFAFKYARFEVILVKKINKDENQIVTAKKLVPESRKLGL